MSGILVQNIYFPEKNVYKNYTLKGKLIDFSLIIWYFIPMGESVSEDILENENKPENNESYVDSSILLYDLKKYYRLIRKKLSKIKVKHSKKQKFRNIFYITTDYVPQNYILSLQKQYPNNAITALKLYDGMYSGETKVITKLEYYMQNKKYQASLVESRNKDNIHVYELSIDFLQEQKKSYNIYKLPYIAHYAKALRTAVGYFKPDIVHCENVPFFLGVEFEKQSKFKPNVFQTFHHYSMYNDIEPFWAAINFADKFVMKRLYNDKVIKKNLAALFNIKINKNYSKIDDCLDYLYKNYDKYREFIDINMNTNDNILFSRLNKRILELFPQILQGKSIQYNLCANSLLKSSYFAINSSQTQCPVSIKNISKKSCCLQRGLSINTKDCLKNNFNIFDFREKRQENKNYLFKEFSLNRIETKFTDLKLFNEEEVMITGFLDGFYKGILIFLPITVDMNEAAIQASVTAILKCFEQRKNIQVIINVPQNYTNSHLTSVVNFLENERSLYGKWLLIKGGLNISQFLASSDLVLFPTSEIIGIEDVLFNALHNGCIPVTAETGICGDILIDIFDDLNKGCGFKHGDTTITEDNFEKYYESVLLKAIQFNMQNPSGWNILIKNAMNFDSSWNFKLIEKYNEIYDKIS